MSEYVRRLARRANRLGLRAEPLGQMNDQHWLAVRHYIDAEDATDLELADVVDHLILVDSFLADPEQVADAPSVLDNFGLIG